jgi:hypothetical protein
MVLDSTAKTAAAEAYREYCALCHAMQTGVMAEQSLGSQDGTPKHLRTGINVALCDHGALIKLLVDKGLITDEEYAVAIRDMMKCEVERYETLLGVKLH